jgi:hypothetical protein
MGSSPDAVSDLGVTPSWSAALISRDAVLGRRFEQDAELV